MKIWYLALTLTACAAQLPGVAGRQLNLAEGGPGTFLAGEIVAISPRAVSERRDFVYAAAASSAPALFAFTHLAAKEFRLGLWQLDPAPVRLADVPLNAVEFDVEALALSPDAARVAAASRDGRVQLFERQGGARVAVAQLDEPLVSAAFSPDGRFLVVGGSRGRLTVLSADRLAFAGELAAHQDEVRGLDFDKAGLLFSGSWDKSIAAYRITEGMQVVTDVRVRYQRRDGYALFPGAVLGGPNLTWTLDARSQRTCLRAAAAAAAGIDARTLEETVELTLPAGPVRAPVARGRALAFKNLRAPGQELAISDSCVPAGAEGVLGQDFLARFDVQLHETWGEARIAAREPEELEKVRVAVPTELRRHRYPHFVNDLTVDRAGQRLGVAFGEAKAERTVQVYEREKAGAEEPVREGNAGAIVDAGSGEVLHRFVAHRGVVSTAAISPDGRSLATGGWDRMLHVFGGAKAPVASERFGWSVRRARFSPDGRYLAVGAWTPQTGRDQDSDPAAVAYDVRYRGPRLRN